MKDIKTIDPLASVKIRAAIGRGILRSGNWGDGTNAVCMMSALVSGADDTKSCVTAGWPEWLAQLNVHLFDATVGAEDEYASRAEFALRIAELVQTPRDYNKARDLFLIARLDTGDYSALKSLRISPVDADWWRTCEKATSDVVALLHRRIAGEGVTSEMGEARSALAAVHAAGAVSTAREVAYAAADAAAYAEDDAAAYVAHAATDAVAHAAASAAADAPIRASRAARAAARADLIAALEASAVVQVTAPIGEQP